MKYITILAPGFIPVSVLFSHHLTHKEVAAKLALTVLGAGVVRVDGKTVKVVSTTNELGISPDPQIDAALIEHDLALTRREHPEIRPSKYTLTPRL
jgi:hypothetical protein